MIVAVDKKLKSLKSKLAALGYDTVYFGEYEYPYDAAVVCGIKGKLTNSLETHTNYGVFYVDGTGKSAKEVSDILQRKLYSPLFF
ncbi:MAG: YkuS family protein [Clostridia bacterium]|nr:YkuS family protein [Clostridia bacterium]